MCHVKEQMIWWSTEKLQFLQTYQNPYLDEQIEQTQEPERTQSITTATLANCPGTAQEWIKFDARTKKRWVRTGYLWKGNHLAAPKSNFYQDTHVGKGKEKGTKTSKDPPRGRRKRTRPRIPSKQRRPVVLGSKEENESDVQWESRSWAKTKQCREEWKVGGGGDEGEAP